MGVWAWMLLGLLIAPVASRASDPSALWNIVNGKCVPHEEAAHDPAPCALVDLAHGVDKGFVVLKDINGVAQFLLIPTARISGIEDPAILEPNETNFWDAAWQHRHLVEERLNTSLPRDALSLAINSSVGRSQNQLHIHIDCVRPDVRTTLKANLEKIGKVWTQFPLPLAGQTYRSIRIERETLDGIDPFRLLVDAQPAARAEIGTHTLVVIGATFPGNRNGFVLLDDHADPMTGDRASGEDLQDHTCAVAAK